MLCLMLCLGSLQHHPTSRCPEYARRACQPRANDGSLDSSVVAELQSRLSRQLSGADASLAKATIRSAVNDLEAHLRRKHEAEAQDAHLAGSQEKDTDAARAAASWGSWRVKAPSDATARARHVLVDSEAQAIALFKELAFGADIGQLAAQHSLCPSKDIGGDLGVFVPGDMAAEFDAFIFDESTPTGTPVGPIKTPFGYHLVIIDDRTL